MLASPVSRWGTRKDSSRAGGGKPNVSARSAWLVRAATRPRCRTRLSRAGREQVTADATAHEHGSPPVVWIDGHLYADARDARVGATDHGLVVGDGVFEALKVTPTGPFALRRHLDRLDRSAAAMGLPAPDRAGDPRRRRGGAGGPHVRARQDPHHLHRRRRPAGLAGRVRLPDPRRRGRPRPTLPPASTDVVTAPWRRNEHGALTGVKSTSYGENVRGLAYAPRPRLRRDDLPEHGRERLRGHRHERLLRLRRRGRHPAAERRPARRDHPRAAARVGRRSSSVT